MTFSPDGKFLVTGGKDGTVRILDRRAEKPRAAVIPKSGGVVLWTGFSQGDELLVGYGDGPDKPGEFSVWELTTKLALQQRAPLAGLRDVGQIHLRRGDLRRHRRGAEGRLRSPVLAAVPRQSPHLGQDGGQAGRRPDTRRQRHRRQVRLDTLFHRTDHAVRPPGEKEGIMLRQCTSEYKIQVCNKATRRELVGLAYRQHMPEVVKVFQYFGITTDETERTRRTPPEKWSVLVYPFIEMGLESGRLRGLLEGPCAAYGPPLGLGPSPNEGERQVPREIETTAHFGQRPWHGLGTALVESDLYDWPSASKKAGLDWEVELVPLAPACSRGHRTSARRPGEGSSLVAFRARGEDATLAVEQRPEPGAANQSADAIRRPTDSLEWPGHVESASRSTGEESRMKMPKSLGMILVAVWLILYGVLTAPFLKFSFAYSADLLAVLAIAAGVLLLLRRD